jgi:cell wall-associated NlpC family hydrolase
MSGYAWTHAYVGTPYRDLGRGFDGVDCWGLVRLVYRHELHIELPGYDGAYVSGDEQAEIAAIVAGAAASDAWTGVDIFSEPSRPFDVAVFRRGRLDCHVGVVIGGGLMLHVARDDCVKVESYRQGQWRHRLAGVYRHRDMVGRAP